MRFYAFRVASRAVESGRVECTRDQPVSFLEYFTYVEDYFHSSAGGSVFAPRRLVPLRDVGEWLCVDAVTSRHGSHERRTHEPLTLQWIADGVTRQFVLKHRHRSPNVFHNND